MRLMRLFVTAVVLSFLAAAGSAQTITCSSEDGRRHYCQADTRNGFEMVHQRSGDPCAEGYSWGYDERGIWVDHGCRADFGMLQPPRIVTCSSEDGKRHYCEVEPHSSVELSRQHSGSPCTRDVTWGVDERGIWVDRGCRAEFAVQIGRPEDETPPVITCSSDDGGRHFCEADTHRGVRMVRQISGSPCTQGTSWDYDGRGIWVDRGCRAEFVLRFRPRKDWNRDRDRDHDHDHDH